MLKPLLPATLSPVKIAALVEVGRHDPDPSARFVDHVAPIALHELQLIECDVWRAPAQPENRSNGESKFGDGSGGRGSSTPVPNPDPETSYRVVAVANKDQLLD